MPHSARTHESPTKHGPAMKEKRSGANATTRKTPSGKRAETKRAEIGKAQGRELADDDSMVQEFLDAFARAVTAGDTKTISRMWDVPAFVLGEDAMVVGSHAEVEKFFSGAKEQYNKRGIVDTRADIENLEWATEGIVIVTVRWPYLDEKGDEVGAESSTYTLARNGDGDLKVRIIVMRGVEE